MTKIITTVRHIDQKEPDYQDIRTSVLQVQKQLMEGTGTAEDPYLYRIQIKNPSAEKSMPLR